MSIRENTASGYVIEASKLVKLLPEKLHADYLELLNEIDYDEAVAFLENNGDGCITPSHMFALGDDDSSSELSLHVVYAYYDEDDLFECRPTVDNTNLQMVLQDSPIYADWSIYG